MISIVRLDTFQRNKEYKTNSRDKYCVKILFFHIVKTLGCLYQIIFVQKKTLAHYFSRLESTTSDAYNAVLLG